MSTNDVFLGGEASAPPRSGLRGDEAAAALLGRSAILGWVPLLSVTTAMGFLVAVFADTRARQLDPNATNLFWVGLLVMFVPNALRLLGSGPSRTERVGCLLLVGLGLYLVKVAQSPLMFTYFDEFLHTRTAEDLVQSGRLFTPNVLLPVSPLYPGMESATSALTMLGGFTTFEGGVVLLAVARLLLVLGLFLFFEAAGGSARVASIATLVYMANPSFIFFSAQFAYESLALPFAVLAIHSTFRRARAADPPLVSWALIVIFGAATVVTHHVSSIALTAMLFLWTAVNLVERWRLQRSAPRQSSHPVHSLRDRGYHRPSPLRPAIFIGVACGTWLILVASTTIGYLAPAIEGAVAQVIQLVAGESGARQLFRGTGPTPPAWEIIAGYTSVMVTLIALPVGFFLLMRRRSLNSALITLAVGALVYPGTQVARLTERGAEISARTITFIFLAVAFVVAVALATSKPLKFPKVWKIAVPGVALTALLIGNVVVAVPIWMRLPGPYLVGADPRSVEPESIGSAEWALEHLGADNRFFADRSNRLMMGTIGRQHLVTVGGDRINLRPAFFATSLGPDELGRLTAGRVRYVLVDRRLSSALPLVGVYTERGEASAGRRTAPIDPDALGKYDRIQNVSRVYDSGNIQIYDIGPLTGADTSGP